MCDRFFYIETEKLIPYSVLQDKLGLESVKEVEDLIIEGMFMLFIFFLLLVTT